MTSPVTIPEKTLEHWASIYVTYRFRSQASQWWPTSGEDIRIGQLPQLPGKAVQLEIKTATPVGPNSPSHDVFVNLAQLRDYMKKPLHQQPFYVLPRPHWQGTLENAAVASGIDPTECAFSRAQGVHRAPAGPLQSGAAWFAQWTLVLTAAEVARILQKELTTHGAKSRTAAGANCRLVRFTTGPSPSERWGSASGQSTSTPTYYGWREYWDRLTRCGDTDWPQIFRVQKSDLDALPGKTYSAAQLRGILLGQPRTDRGKLAHRDYADLVAVIPDGHGEFIHLDDSRWMTGVDVQGGDLVEEVRDLRSVVFLDASSVTN